MSRKSCSQVSKTFFVLSLVVACAFFSFVVDNTFSAGFLQSNKPFESEAFSTKTPFSLEFLASFDEQWGMPVAVTATERFAFIACMWGGLIIVDLAIPSQPKVVSTFDSRALVGEAVSHDSTEVTFDLVLQGELIFLADGLMGLQIINVSNPFKPYRIGMWADSLSVSKVRLSGSRAYLHDVGFGNTPIRVIDVSDPSQPFFVYNISLPEFYNSIILDFSVQDGLLFAAGVNSYIYNLSSDSVSLIAPIPDGCNRFCLFADNLFITTITATGPLFRIINLSDPSSPLLLGELALTLELPDSIVVQNSSVFIVDSRTKDLTSISIANYSAPVLLGSTAILHIRISSKKCCIFPGSAGTTLLCVEEEFGLTMLDVSNPETPFLRSSFDFGGFVVDLFVFDAYLYLVYQYNIYGSFSKLVILSLVDGLPDQKVGEFLCTSGMITSVVVRDGFAYLSVAGAGLVVVDVREPSTPVQASSFHFGESYSGYDGELALDPEQAIVYLCKRFFGLLIINCSNPFSPSLLAAVPTAPMIFPYDIVIRDGFAYLSSAQYADDGGFAIINITDPATPEYMVLFPASPCSIDILVHGTTLFLTFLEGSLSSFDISNMSNPYYLGTFTTNIWGSIDVYRQYTTLEFVEGYVCIAVTKGYLFIDATKPSKLKLSGEYYPTNYTVSTLEPLYHDKKFYSAAGFAGVQVFEVILPVNSQEFIVLLSTTIPAAVVISVAVPVVIFAFKKRKMPKKVKVE